MWHAVPGMKSRLYYSSSFGITSPLQGPIIPEIYQALCGFTRLAELAILD